jgi:hypothetical protein
MAPKTIKTGSLKARDFVAMGEYVYGKGGPHRNLKKYNRKSQKSSWKREA